MCLITVYPLWEFSYFGTVHVGVVGVCVCMYICVCVSVCGYGYVGEDVCAQCALDSLSVCVWVGWRESILCVRVCM